MSNTWFITGSSRGLGRDIAETALEAGANVVATARKPEQLNDLVDRYGDRVLTLALDVTDPDAVRQAIRTATERFERLDVVVNNAGYGDVAAIEDVTDEAFRAQIDANFYGTYYVTKAVVPLLRQQGSGHIFQISSVGGRVGNAGLAAYQAAKFAVEGFSEVLAQEVASFGIKVTLIEPGAMRTDWAGSSMTIPDISEPYQSTIGQLAQMMRQFDGQQGGDPKKVAAAIQSIALREDAPLRLLMGADAYEIATNADRQRGESDAQWRDLTESIAFDA